MDAGLRPSGRPLLQRADLLVGTAVGRWRRLPGRRHRPATIWKFSQKGERRLSPSRRPRRSRGAAACSCKSFGGACDVPLGAAAIARPRSVSRMPSARSSIRPSISNRRRWVDDSGTASAAVDRAMARRISCSWVPSGVMFLLFMVDLQVNVACDRRLQPVRALPTVRARENWRVPRAHHLDDRSRTAHAYRHLPRRRHTVRPRRIS
ncbi:hypothetical protein SAMN02990966_01341 [Rhodospirillales bacterium URHD0017]|nr:hypothetical protein SAMN02990966_01341 [Rhodospirillales bacterium URHD0017]